jgi:N-acylneuraminate cytidylyltransferase
MKNNFTAVIPVRAGSRRLKNKNISSFNGSNLLVNKINQLKKVESISNIVVSSDSYEMLEMAKKENVLTHKRSWEYCDEKTKSFGEVVAHIASSVIGENIVWATCTSPLVLPSSYDLAISLFNKYVIDLKKNDSLITVEPFQRYMWNKDGPINYKLGIEHVPSQNLPLYYFVTDGILISKRLNMIKWQYFHGTNPYKMELEKRQCIDIDDVLDLKVAKAWL